MADRSVTLGRAAAAAVLFAVALPICAVLWRAGGTSAPGPADWSALRFSLVQGALSSVLSVALAIPVARALARRRFAGRRLVITLMGAPFLLPTIVAVLGLLAVFGRQGLLNQGLMAVGLPPVSIYGLQGVVLAHVFLNLPLAVRLILLGWAGIPAERFRLAAQLGFSSDDSLRLIEWPMLRGVLPGAMAVIFSVCLTSFAVALTLGGGPRATTVELAIYQAFRFDFDLGRAAMLAMLQLGLAGLAGVLALRGLRHPDFGAGMDRPQQRWDTRSPALRLFDALVIGFAALFLLVPLGMISLRGLAGLGDLGAPVWRSAGVSITVALAATAVTLALALPMALALARSGRGWWIDGAGLLGLAVSPLVLGTGLFLLILPLAPPQDWALVVTTLVNALMALPFALRALVPPARDLLRGYDRLSASLNMQGTTWLRLVALPRLAAPLGFAGGLSAALSMGDLGVVALFSDPDRATLPLQVVRLMGAYRTEQAAAAALLLLVLSLSAFWLFDRGGRHAAS